MNLFSKEELKESMSLESYLIVIVIAALLIVPLFVGEFFIYILTLGTIFAIFAASWDFLICSDQFSLGHSFFFGIGAYSTGFLTLYFGFSPIPALVLSAVIASMVGLVLSFPFLRVRAMYYTISTIAFATIAEHLIPKFPSITGGEEGLIGIPSLIVGRYSNFYLMIGMMVMSLLCMYYIVFHTGIGKSFNAMRDDEEAAKGRGVNISKYRILGIVISSLFAGLAGSLWAFYTNSVSVYTVTVIPLAADIILMGLFGGTTTIIGPVIGAYVLTLLGEAVRAIQGFRLIIYSGIVVAILLLAPDGLIGIIKRIMKKLKGSTPPGGQT